MHDLRFEYVLHEKSYWLFNKLACKYPFTDLKYNSKYWIILLEFGYKRIYLVKGNLPFPAIKNGNFKLRVDYVSDLSDTYDLWNRWTESEYGITWVALPEEKTDLARVIVNHLKVARLG